MQCPVCGSKKVKIVHEDLDEYDATRDLMCQDCESSWQIYGEPIIVVVEANWDDKPQNLKYGLGIDVAALELETIMQEAKQKTILMF